MRAFVASYVIEEEAAEQNLTSVPTTNAEKHATAEKETARQAAQEAKRKRPPGCEACG